MRYKIVLIMLVVLAVLWMTDCMAQDFRFRDTSLSDQERVDIVSGKPVDAGGEAEVVVHRPRSGEVGYCEMWVYGGLAWLGAR